LSLGSIFGNHKPDPGHFDPAKVRVIVATGDVIPAREVNEKVIAHRDFSYPWRRTVDVLRQGDLLFIDLESPLLAGCPPTHTGMTFCGDPRNVEGLSFAGVSVANIANNHSYNYGQRGVDQTVAALARHNIAACGLGHLAIRTVRGLRFAFLGYNGVGAGFNRRLMQTEIGAARRQADVIIVQPHWGKEYELFPKRAAGIAPDDPRQIGRLMIDAGADLVIGNHPHWVQPVEIYRGKLITYAHGNFIFDQMWSTQTREGVVGRYTFYGTQLMRVDYLPLRIDDYSQPHFIDPSRGEGLGILTRMEQGSERLAIS
jgi:poly-gamma-glutamate synthesis protein (capsule biosynthesis protein)